MAPLNNLSPRELTCNSNKIIYLCYVCKRLFILNKHLCKLLSLIRADSHYVPQQENPVWSIPNLKRVRSSNSARTRSSVKATVSSLHKAVTISSFGGGYTGKDAGIHVRSLGIISNKTLDQERQYKLSDAPKNTFSNCRAYIHYS